MRLFGRRGEDAVARYAAVLDGAHLWLDTGAATGSVSLHETRTGTTIELGPAPHDLSGLASPTPAISTTYDVLLAGASLTLAQSRPAAGTPTRTPLAPDGVTRWQVGSGEDGRLVLTGHAVGATAELDRVEVRGEAIHLRLTLPRAPVVGRHLLLLDQEDHVLETLPVTAHHDSGREVGQDSVEALIGVDDLPAGYFAMIRLALDGPTRLRIRRRHDDLVDAHQAVLLPELYVGTPPIARARLRWNADGLLAIRSLDPHLTPGRTQ